MVYILLRAKLAMPKNGIASAAPSSCDYFPVLLDGVTLTDGHGQRVLMSQIGKKRGLSASTCQPQLAKSPRYGCYGKLATLHIQKKGVSPIIFSL